MRGKHIEIGYLSNNVELGGKPARFKKELIRVGKFRHPQDPGVKIDITEERLRQWADNFKRAGVKVWVPYRHSTDPQDNTGWVEKMFVDNGKLFAVMRIVDDETKRMLREGIIEDVSVGIDLDYLDAEGRNVGEVIRHVALTLDPVIRGQSGFIEVNGREDETISDDEGGVGMPKTTYAYVDPETGEGYYPHHNDDGSVDVEKVKAALEELEGADIPEEVKAIVREHLLDHLEAAKDRDEEPAAIAAAAERDTFTRLLELEALSAELSARNKELRRNIRALRSEQNNTRRMVTEQEVDEYIALGKITPACRPEALSILLGGSGKTVEFEGNKTTVAALFRRFIDKMPAVLEFGEHFVLERTAAEEGLSETEEKMLKALGVTLTDIRDYAGAR